MWPAPTNLVLSRSSQSALDTEIATGVDSGDFHFFAELHSLGLKLWYFGLETALNC